MMLVSTLVFVGAATASFGTLATTVAPQWRRILRLASGQVEQPFAPLAQLAITERRIAVRRWASDSAPSPVVRWRAAA